MGFFGLFGRKKEERSVGVEERKPSMPTVAVDRKLVEMYEQVFFQQMAEIKGVGRKEAKEILSIITKEHGGFQDLTYCEVVFKRYFQGCDWTWPEYEEWNEVFARLGKYPHRWPHSGTKTDVDMFDVFGKMKVGELKEYLLAHGVVVPDKTRRDGLLKLIEDMPGLKELEPWRTKSTEWKKYREEMKGHAECMAFLRHIGDKARSQFEEERRYKLGIKEEKLSMVFPEEQQFVQIALERNPAARPPFYPTDASMLRAVIPGFEDE